MALSVALFLPAAAALLIEAALLGRGRLSLFGLFCSAVGGAAALLALSAFDSFLAAEIPVNAVTAAYAVTLGPPGALLVAALALLPK